MCGVTERQKSKMRVFAVEAGGALEQVYGSVIGVPAPVFPYPAACLLY